MASWPFASPNARSNRCAPDAASRSEAAEHQERTTMTHAIGNETTIGIACLGITHPHTSGRVKAFQRMPNARLLGAYDDSPLLTPFVDALGLESRSKEDIL